jgi:hypothetical protein
VTVNSNLQDTDETAFTYTGVKFRPYSPVNITGSRDGSDNLTINWNRRTRINGDWRDNVDVPLGEESESYEIDIMDGRDVVRTITATSQTVEYTAAQQTTDLGSTQSSITVNVYQLSAVYGRGAAGNRTI